MSGRIQLAMLFVVLIWGSAYVGIRASLESYSPGGLALLRFLVASLTIYFIFIKREQKKPIVGKDLILAIATGAIGIGIYNISLNYGELIVPAGMAAFIVSQSPVITTVLALFFLQERITWYGALGMLISVVGVGLIALSRMDELNFYVGIFYVLIAALVGGLYSILQKKLLKKEHQAIDLVAYAIWGGTFVLLIFTPDLVRDVREASFTATLTVIYLGVFPATLAYLAWGYILQEIPASRAVSFLYFTPLAATLVEWIWLGEKPTLLEFFGGMVALLGVWLVNQTFSKKNIVTQSA